MTEARGVLFGLILAQDSSIIRLFKDWTVRMLECSSRILILSFFVLLAGCAVSTKATNTPRSTVEQRLLVRSLERALATLDTQRFKGKAITIEFYGLTPDKDFAKEFFTAWLQEQHVRMATDPKEAQLRLKVFASVLGVDQGQSFIGSPSFTVPLVGVVVPEIPLFKDVRHTGFTEVDIYTLDARSGEFVDKSPRMIGEARYDDYTILILIKFTSTDVPEQKWDWDPGLR